MEGGLHGLVCSRTVGPRAVGPGLVGPEIAEATTVCLIKHLHFIGKMHSFGHLDAAQDVLGQTVR